MDKGNVGYIHTMEYYSAIKKEILPLVTTWMDPEGIMLSEVSQTEKNKYHKISLTCGILEKNKETPHRYKEQTGDCRQGWGMEDGDG